MYNMTKINFSADECKSVGTITHLRLLDKKDEINMVDPL